MRTNLKVPFAEKDEAKALGARWDAARKLWYVKDVADLSAFARWNPEPAAGQGGGSPASGGRKVQEAAEVRVGSRYFELACTCVAWEGCPACRQAVEARDWGGRSQEG